MKFNKSDEKFIRVRYIRSLERFVNSGISMLKKEDFDLFKFKEKIQKNYIVLSKVTPIYLDSPYLKMLENFAKDLINLDNKDELLKGANKLEQLKNSKNYKKFKHKKDIYEDHNF